MARELSVGIAVMHVEQFAGSLASFADEPPTSSLPRLRQAERGRTLSRARFTKAGVGT
jgi:hypothetical protein